LSPGFEQAREERGKGLRGETDIRPFRRKNTSRKGGVPARKELGRRGGIKMALLQGTNQLSKEKAFIHDPPRKKRHRKSISVITSKVESDPHFSERKEAREARRSPVRRGTNLLYAKRPFT